MRGHEHVRSSVLAYLETAVPERLGMLRDDLSVTSPVDPATYGLADSLTLATEYPVVLVRSTSVPGIVAETTVVEAQTSSWFVRYDLEVVVACSTAEHGSYDAACVDRDRLLLATREALLLATDVGDDIELVRSGMSEDTGPAAETLRGAPLAVGSISLAALVEEVLVPSLSGAVENIDAIDDTYPAYDASQSIPEES